MHSVKTLHPGRQTHPWSIFQAVRRTLDQVLIRYLHVYGGLLSQHFNFLLERVIVSLLVPQRVIVDLGVLKLTSACAGAQGTPRV